uniref:Uncharacterized protein n=1 Tax=Oryza glumipatula TaxID=40148 RepID=A0A0D9YH15_9ORYZ
MNSFQQRLAGRFRDPTTPHWSSLRKRGGVELLDFLGSGVRPLLGVERNPEEGSSMEDAVLDNEEGKDTMERRMIGMEVVRWRGGGQRAFDSGASRVKTTKHGAR